MARYFLPALLAIGVCSCAGPSNVEVARAASPSGKVEAVLFETNGGATTSFGYVIKLRGVGPGRQDAVTVGKLYGAIRNDCAYGVDLNWTGPDALSVSFDEARWVRIPATVRWGGGLVSIEVKSGVKNPSAPCGGMEYNL